MHELATILETLPALERLRALLEMPPDAAARAHLEVVLEGRVPVADAAALNSVHPSTFRKHFGHLVKKFGPRLELVRLRDALTLPPKDTG
jgi:hypothetical protein